MLKTKKKQDSGLVETIKTVLYAVLIALGIRTVAYEPFNIPSESMLPTLLVGDYLFVSKFAYGYSRHSLPFGIGNVLPAMGRVPAGVPKRGDVVVFKLPRDNSTDYIKRVIGLPGDTIQMKGGVLFLNGKEVPRRRVDDFRYSARIQYVERIAQYVETLPDGRAYSTLDLMPRSDTDDTGVFTVPAGHVFAMGDNRDNSLDSRVAPERGGVGYIPVENIVGRAEVLFVSTEGALWEIWRWRFGRLFNLVD